jgi:glycosyltransferase involved in cell wall biosynthesis
MKKSVLFLYGNTPMSLHVNMMCLLRENGKYDLKLLYYDRGSSPIKFPLPTQLDQEQTFAVRWPVGSNSLIKFFNRMIVIMLLIKKIWHFNPDVIHAWNLDMLITARLATLGRKRTKVIFNLQDTTEWMLSPTVKALQRWAYRGADLIFVTSQGFETCFLRKFELIDKNKKVVFVTNVPSGQQFIHFEPRKPDDSLTVGYIGTIRGREGIEALVQAAKLARNRGADIRVLFAGTGKERLVVETLSREHSFVDYLGPYRYDQKISDMYAQVDVLYALYDHSYDKKIHFAYRLSDAIHCSLPIIVAKGTHMAAIVEKFDIGVSVELGDVDELAQALEKLAYSPADRTRFARNCKKARPEFVFEHYQERISAAYDDLWVSP